MQEHGMEIRITVPEQMDAWGDGEPEPEEIERVIANTVAAMTAWAEATYPDAEVDVVRVADTQSYDGQSRVLAPDHPTEQAILARIERAAEALFADPAIWASDTDPAHVGRQLADVQRGAATLGRTGGKAGTGAAKRRGDAAYYKRISALGVAARRRWYTYVGAGSDPKPSRGPHSTRRDADAAMERFRERHGALADTYLAAGSVILIACPSRRAAREADISDWPRYGKKA